MGADESEDDDEIDDEEDFYYLEYLAEKNKRIKNLLFEHINR